MKRIKEIKLLLIFISFGLLTHAQTELKQTIKGVVTDADSKKLLASANVILVGSANGAITDSAGNFKITDVSIGRHSLQISLTGYETAGVAEILVTSGKEIFLTVSLREKVVRLEEVKLVGRKNRLKASNEFAGASSRSFSVEETKRYAAAAFDPARMAQNFAGVSNNGDGDNSIVVRGNSPKGVLWRLEGIEIPNPNHFGALGGSGGSISMLSSSTLGNSDFYTGAFPAEFGNATSGAFDLKFRDGNKDKREHSVMIGGLGLEVASEGPFKKGGKSSYLVNYRYSTLSLLKGFLDLQGIAPDYQDLSFKFTFPTNKLGTFSLFGIAGSNRATREPDKDSTLWDDDNPNYALNSKGKLGVVGLSHQIFLSERSYLKTVISASGERYDQQQDTLTAKNNYATVPTFDAKFIDNAFRISVLYNNKINSRHTFRTGIIASRLAFDYVNNYFDENENGWKNLLDSKGNTLLYQAYAQWKFRVNNKLSVNGGLHGTLLSLNQSKSIEPRASVNYQLGSTQSVTFSAGVHSKPEHMSTYFYERKDAGQVLTHPNKDLDITKAFHMVLAYDKSFKNGLRFKSEIYYQRLYNVPVEKKVDGFYSAINASDIYSLYETDSALVSQGKGTNYGIDLSLERSFTRNFYFLIAGSLFKSTYTTFNRDEFSTKFDRNYQVNVVAGKEWKVGKDKRRIIGINGKFLGSGSLRDSPIDFIASTQAREAVYVKDKYFTLKGDPYYRFDIGISFKINRQRATHSISLDIQNLTNHQNLYVSYYDKDKEAIKKVYQMGLFPIFNYRIEF